jgi:hypothetical protein
MSQKSLTRRPTVRSISLTLLRKFSLRWFLSRSDTQLIANTGDIANFLLSESEIPDIFIRYPGDTGA